MNKEFELKLRSIISECIHEEFLQRKHLNEMARVGIMSNIFDVIVYTDDKGYIPHVHIVDKATNGNDFGKISRIS